MRISDWSSDVCSSDLVRGHPLAQLPEAAEADQVERRLQRPGQVEGRVEVGVAEVVPLEQVQLAQPEIGREPCRERVCQYVSIWVVAVALKQKKITRPYIHNT